MPSGGWRYIAQRLTGDGSTGNFLDFDLPLHSVNITDTLSGHNSITGTISPEYARLLGPDGEPLLDEWGTAIWAENQGVIRGGGILTHSGFDGPTWNLECTGYTGYLVELPYMDEWFGVEIDPLDVVRKIWNHVQSQPGSNLGLEVAALKTGLKIGTELKQAEFDTQSGPVSFESGPVKLAWYQTFDLAAEVNRLANETPFDWHERHYWDGNIIRHKLDFGFPRLGQRRTNLRFVVGENLSRIPSVDRDGTMYASEAMVLGAGNGAGMKRGAASRKVKKLRRVAVVQDSSLRSVKSANSRAEREMAWRAELDDFTEVYVRDHPHSPIGAVSVGDEILIEGDCGWRTLDTWVRVLSITTAPESGEGQVLSVVRSDKLAA